MKIIFLLFISFNLINMAQAGSWSGVGNGGFIIECDGHKEIFDYYEAKQDGLNLEYQIPGESLSEKLDFLFKRLQWIDPNRYLNYKYQYDNYWQLATKLSSPILVLDHEDVKDKEYQEEFGLGDIEIPENCTLNLVIKQEEPDYDDDKVTRTGRLDLKIFTNEWDELNSDIQAALIMHELFYRENILRREHFTSQKIRRLNALLNSNTFDNLTKDNWHQHLVESYLYPMFPNFSPIEDNVESLDLEVAWTGIPGYLLYDYSEPILKGVIEFDGIKGLPVVAQSPLFLDGFYPEYFSLQSERNLDLSFLTDRSLVVGVDSQCIFKMGFVRLQKSPTLLSLGLNQSFDRDENCTAYLQDKPKYKNEKIKHSGTVPVTFVKDPRAEVVNQLTLYKTELNILKLKIANKFVKVSKIVVNLSNGEIVDFKK